MVTRSAERVATLAATIRAEVARRNLRQKAIGSALGLDQRAVSRRLQGQVEWSATEVIALARLLDVDAAVLLASPEPAAAP